MSTNILFLDEFTTSEVTSQSKPSRIIKTIADAEVKQQEGAFACPAAQRTKMGKVSGKWDIGHS
jgi:hypothetical protein